MLIHFPICNGLHRPPPAASISEAAAARVQCQVGLNSFVSFDGVDTVIQRPLIRPTRTGPSDQVASP